MTSQIIFLSFLGILFSGILVLFGMHIYLMIINLTTSKIVINEGKFWDGKKFITWKQGLRNKVLLFQEDYLQTYKITGLKALLINLRYGK
jgi:hypothetical protein